jgi:hypothetical protein
VVGTMLATLLSTVDSTITNVALPAMQGNLGASMDEATCRPCSAASGIF